MTTGNEFRGFHIRFRDVARGGIRIVRSRNKECVYMISLYSFDLSINDLRFRNYSINQRML